MGERDSQKISKNFQIMKSYFADTNFYLRFIFKDNQNQAKQAKEFLQKAKEKRIKIVFLSEVILEMGFVLRSVYSLSKTEIVKILSILVKTEYLEIPERNLWLETFEIYQQKNISLFDIYLFLQSQKEKAEILSFNKDFKKLK